MSKQTKKAPLKCRTLMLLCVMRSTPAKPAESRCGTSRRQILFQLALQSEDLSHGAVASGEVLDGCGVIPLI